MKSERGGNGRPQAVDADQIDGEYPGEEQRSRSCLGRRQGSYYPAENLTRPFFTKGERGQSKEKTR